jgi:hypothetical protein
MAVITSAASGNFSSPATWVGGVVPGLLDNAIANTGHNVTIDINTTVIDIQAISTGRFIMEEGVTLTGNVQGSQTTNGITLLIPVTTNCTINGNIIGGSLNVQTTLAAQKTGTGVLNINGDISNGSIIGRRGLEITQTGNVNITGNVFTVNTNHSAATVYALTISTNANVNITGNVFHNSVSPIQPNSPVIFSSVNPNVTIVGDITHAGGSAIVLQGANSILTITGNLSHQQNSLNPVINTSGLNNEVTITGNIFAGVSGNGVNISGNNSQLTFMGNIFANNSGTTTGILSTATTRGLILGGDFHYGISGAVPFRTNLMKITPTTNGKTVYRTTSGVINTRAELTAVDFNIPLEQDVRQGLVYGDSTFTGTLVVPSPSNVRKGVLTDNTVGTADLNAQDFLDLLSTSTDPIAERLRNVATVETTGAQIAGFL